MIDINMKQGNLLPSIQHPCTMADDSPVSLVGATVVFRFRPQSGGPSRGGSCTILDAPNAHIAQYDWRPGDTDAAGVFDAEFTATFPGAKPLTFPNYGYLRMVVAASIPEITP